MEEEKLVNEFRLGDVVAQVSRYAATGGRSWLTTRVGRYYTVDGEERFTTYLKLDDIPVAIYQLLEAYKWQKGNPQPSKSNREE